MSIGILGFIFMALVPLGQIFARVVWMNGSLSLPWLLLPPFWIFPLSVIQDSCIDSITNAFDNKITVEDFIQTFVRENFSKKRKPTAKKRNETIIIEREDDDPVIQIQVESEDKKGNAKTKRQKNRGVVFSKKNKKRLLIIEDDE
jgi:hypothetical protein